MKNGIMRDGLILFLTATVFFAGCGGREANLVQIRQLGDEQKGCDQLRTEMNFIQNEISRLIPKSDKTGKNIALAATGVMFIVPLFFMDLKQGEKKEIEAYQQRYNHLLMMTQQRDCKLIKVVAKEDKPTQEQVIKCNLCNSAGQEDSQWKVVNGKLTCLDCYDKQKDSKELAKARSNGF